MNDEPGGGGAQVHAANPTESVWVSANAGTGKTRVLVDRISRLLLAGTEPGKILCLTFTKAAAAEMANRLNRRLSHWAAIGDEERKVELAELFGRPATDEETAKAARLFAETVEAPEGLHIRTIHSFCESLLGRFPLEAGVAPHFSVIDERTTEELRTEARDRLLADVFLQKPAALTGALGLLAELVNEDQFADIMRELDAGRGRIEALLKIHGSVDKLLAAGRSALGLDAGETKEQVVAVACDEDAFDHAALSAARDALGDGSPTDKERGKAIAAWLGKEPAKRAESFFAEYAPVFVKKDGEAKAATSLVTKKLAEKNAEAAAAMLAEQARVLSVLDRLKAIATVEATSALLVVGEALIGAFERLKRARALIDYDDLIESARRLLATDGGVSWVHYKLDGGIDHVLVDEAQDTAPGQWDVVAALSGDFFAGESGHDEPRTVFAVGDEKQSIYSFQGADPARFGVMEEHFGTLVEAAGGDWRPVEMNLSWRSVPAVLKAVDAVFGPAEAADGLSWRDRPIQHNFKRAGQGGVVELWPTVKPADGGDDDPWDAPLDQLSAQSPQSRLAERIAGHIRDWLDSGEVLESAKRPIRPGDVMILVRTRGAFAEEVVRALERKDVPVAGRDRLVLTDHLGVMDLIALGRFVLLPEDDLNTAVVLKGPFVELDDDHLFELAHGRAGTLWQALADRAGDDAAFGAARDKLAHVLGRADTVAPYEFYAGVLGGGGLSDLLAHLGAEVREPVEEFLSAALSFEREHAPSLQGFLHWMETGQTQIKRDLEQGRDEVRVMTVHGAKGLQANIVFLADTCSPPRPQSDARLRWGGGGDGFVLWPVVADNEGELTARLRAEARLESEREYRRLLYVAMTRARDRLYVAGWEGRTPPPAGCWYRMIEAAVDEGWVEIALGDGDTGRRLVTKQTEPPDGVADELPLTGGGISLPDWAAVPPPAEPAPPRPLAPSRTEDDEPPVGSPLADDGQMRFKRGRLVHRLLQSLPEVDPSAREAAARRFLAGPAHGLDAAARADILAETMAVLDHPDFASLFAPGSRAEVPITGVIGEVGDGEPRVVSGQIDRLAVTEDEVVVVDYKTNRPPPETEADVADVYLRQMAVYRQALRLIYPDRPVRACLLWTDGPRLMELGEAVLDGALD